MAGISVNGDKLVIDPESELAVYNDTLRFVNFDMKNGNLDGTVNPSQSIAGSIATVHTISGNISTVHSI